MGGTRECGVAGGECKGLGEKNDLRTDQPAPHLRPTARPPCEPQWEILRAKKQKKHPTPFHRTTTVLPEATTACWSQRIEGRSRWFVGSSKRRTSTAWRRRATAR